MFPADLATCLPPSQMCSTQGPLWLSASCRLCVAVLFSSLGLLLRPEPLGLQWSPLLTGWIPCALSVLAQDLWEPGRVTLRVIHGVPKNQRNKECLPPQATVHVTAVAFVSERN